MGRGVLTQAGAAVQAAWRTAIALTDRIPLRSEDLSATWEQHMQEALMNNAQRHGMQLGVKMVGGSLVTDLIYTALDGGDFISADTLLATMMGACTWHADSTSNNLRVSENVHDYGLTLSIDREGGLWEAVGALVKSGEITCEVNGKAQATFDVVCYDMVNTGHVNAIAALNALSVQDLSHILGHHMSFQLGTNLEAAPGAVPLVSIGKATINFSRTLSDNEYATPEAAGHTDSAHPIKPIINGFREVTLEIEAPRYEDDTYFDYLMNEDAVQAILSFTRPVAPAYQMDFYFPNLRVIEHSANIAGESVIPQTVKFQAFLPTAASGQVMEDGAAVGAEIGISLVNQRTATIF